MSELLKCPMCGIDGDPEIAEKRMKDGDEYNGVYVRCGNCGLSITAFETCYNESKEKATEKAVKEWNTRDHSEVLKAIDEWYDKGDIDIEILKEKIKGLK